MAKFKQGDRVRRRIDTPATRFTPGEIYTVSGYNNFGHMLTVELGRHYSVIDTLFELVEPSVTEQEARKAAADKLRAARDAFNAACNEAVVLGLAFACGAGVHSVIIVADSITYRKVVEETY